MPDLQFLQRPRRKTLAETIAERAGRPGSAFEIPNLLRPAEAPPEEPYGPPLPTAIDRMEQERRQLDAVPTRKQSLLQAISQAAPIAIGGLFGGSEGAYGAGQGVEQGWTEQTRQRELRRKTLSEEIEAQKNREERLSERKLTVSANEQATAERAKAAEEATKMRGDIASQGNTLKEIVANQANTTKLSGQTNTQVIANRRLGLDAQGNPIPREQLTPQEQSRIAVNDSLEELHAAQADFERSKNDPSAPAYQLALKRVQTAQQNAATAIGTLNLGRDKFNAQFMGTAPGGEALPGIATTPEGTPIGTTVSNAGKLGMTAENRATSAAAIQRLAPKIIQEINANRDKMGGITGNLEDWIIGKGFSNNPELRTLQTDLASLAPFVSQMHAARGTQGMIEEFKTAVARLKDYPDNAIASMRANAGIAQTVLDIIQDIHPGAPIRDLGQPPARKPQRPVLPGANRIIEYDKTGKRITK